MDLEGPLLSGEYPIGDHRVHEAADYPGVFLARFGIGKGNALGRGFEMGYRAKGGSMVIDSINKHFIEGRASIIGYNGDPTHCKAPDGEDASFNPKGNHPRCPGPRDMVIEAKFGVIPRLPAGAERLGKSLTDCIVCKPDS